MLLSHIEPLTEQQLLAVCELQQSTQETEEALSQGHGALMQSLLDTVISDSLSCASNVYVANYMGQMAVAMNKLATLEEFVRQVSSSSSPGPCLICKADSSLLYIYIYIYETIE